MRAKFYAHNVYLILLIMTKQRRAILAPGRLFAGALSIIFVRASDSHKDSDCL